jgi:hypothetical protein
MVLMVVQEKKKPSRETIIYCLRPLILAWSRRRSATRIRVLPIRPPSARIRNGTTGLRPIRSTHPRDHRRRRNSSPGLRHSTHESPMSKIPWTTTRIPGMPSGGCLAFRILTISCPNARTKRRIAHFLGEEFIRILFANYYLLLDIILSSLCTVTYDLSENNTKLILLDYHLSGNFL